MHTGVDCLVCFMQQALTTVKRATQDEALQRQILIRLGRMLQNLSMESSPPENLVHGYRLIAKMTSTPDPFAAIKRQSNDYALGLETTINEAIGQAPDPLRAALRFAIAANVLDNGSQKKLDIQSTLAKCQQQQLAIDHYLRLRDKLANSRRILVLTDNCGEIVFDKLLIQQLLAMGLAVTVAVRGMPIINDATYEDAKYCGLNDICRVISNGADIPGTSLPQCSAEFLEVFKKADCILSKGMGNFECFSDVDAPIFFLFTIKCSTVLNYLKGLYPTAQVHIGSPIMVSFHG